MVEIGFTFFTEILVKNEVCDIILLSFSNHRKQNLILKIKTGCNICKVWDTNKAIVNCSKHEMGNKSTLNFKVYSLKDQTDQDRDWYLL